MTKNKTTSETGTKTKTTKRTPDIVSTSKTSTSTVNIVKDEQGRKYRVWVDEKGVGYKEPV